MSEISLIVIPLLELPTSSARKGCSNCFIGLRYTFIPTVGYCAGRR
jgi:hypothetical protein